MDRRPRNRRREETGDAAKPRIESKKGKETKQRSRERGNKIRNTRSESRAMHGIQPELDEITMGKAGTKPKMTAVEGLPELSRYPKRGASE